MASADYYALKRAELEAETIGNQYNLIAQSVQTAGKLVGDIFGNVAELQKADKLALANTLTAMTNSRVADSQIAAQLIQNQRNELAARNELLESVSEMTLAPMLERVSSQLHRGDASGVAGLIEYFQLVDTLVDKPDSQFRPSDRLRQGMFNLQNTAEIKKLPGLDMTYMDAMVAVRNPLSSEHTKAIDFLRVNSPDEAWSKLEPLLPQASVAQMRVRLGVPQTREKIQMEAQDELNLLDKRLRQYVVESQIGDIPAAQLAARRVIEVIADTARTGMHSNDPDEVRNTLDILREAEKGRLNAIADQIGFDNAMTDQRGESRIRIMSVDAKGNATESTPGGLKRFENPIKDVTGIPINTDRLLRENIGGLYPGAKMPKSMSVTRYLITARQNANRPNELADISVVIAQGLQDGYLSTTPYQVASRFEGDAETSRMRTILSTLAPLLANESSAATRAALVRGAAGEVQSVVDAQGRVGSAQATAAGRVGAATVQGDARKYVADRQVDIAAIEAQAKVDHGAFQAEQSKVKADAATKVAEIEKSKAVEVAQINAAAGAARNRTQYEIADMRAQVDLIRIGGTEQKKAQDMVFDSVFSSYKDRDKELNAMERGIKKNEKIPESTRTQQIASIERIRTLNKELVAMMIPYRAGRTASITAETVATLSAKMAEIEAAYSQLGGGTPAGGDSEVVMHNGAAYRVRK